MRETQSQSPLYLKVSNKFTYNTVHNIMTENRMNNKYRTLNKALKVVGFEDATVHCNVATYSFNSRLSSFNRLDISALDNLCKDLKTWPMLVKVLKTFILMRLHLNLLIMQLNMQKIGRLLLSNPILS